MTDIPFPDSVIEVGYDILESNMPRGQVFPESGTRVVREVFLAMARALAEDDKLTQWEKASLAQGKNPGKDWTNMTLPLTDIYGPV